MLRKAARAVETLELNAPIGSDAVGSFIAPCNLGAAFSKKQGKPRLSVKRDMPLREF